MRTIALLIYLAVFLMWMYTGQAISYDATDIDVLSISQRERVLTETEYWARECYYAMQVGEWCSMSQLLQIMKQYNDCFYWDMC